MSRHRRRMPPMYQLYRCTAAGSYSMPPAPGHIATTIEWTPCLSYKVGDVARVYDHERLREKDRRARARRPFRQSHRIRHSKRR